MRQLHQPVHVVRVVSSGLNLPVLFRILVQRRVLELVNVEVAAPPELKLARVDVTDR